MRNRSSLVVLIAVLLLIGKASASTDINGLFDARSHGMGSTGVAYIDSPGAIPINPALLDQVGKISISADVFGIVAQPTAPYTIWHKNAAGQYYTNYESVRSKASFAPLPFLGMAYRLPWFGGRAVLGLGAYPIIGQGASATYRPAPDEYPGLVAKNKVSMGLVEVGDALSIRLHEKVSLGLMWRITYMTQTVNTPVDTYNPPAGILLNADRTAAANANITASGLNFKGFQIGLLYKPIPSLRLGLTYRNKIVVDGSGKTVTHLGSKEINLDTRRGFANPHTIRAGLAWSTLQDKLLLAVDFKYLFYAEAWTTLKTVTTQPNGDKQTDIKPVYWNNSWNLQLGAEYKVGSVVALRAGYCFLRSATNPDYALSYLAPPGISHLVTAGLGFKVADSFDINAAAGYVVLDRHINKATFDSDEHPLNAGVGIYASHGAEFSPVGDLSSVEPMIGRRQGELGAMRGVIAHAPGVSVAVKRRLVDMTIQNHVPGGSG